MYKPFKMKGKSPLMKKLVGKQHNLPEHLKAKIKAAPESPNKKYKSDAQRKAVHASKAESAMKKKSCGSAYKMKNKPCPGCKTMCAGCKGKSPIKMDDSKKLKKAKAQPTASEKATMKAHNQALKDNPKLYKDSYYDGRRKKAKSIKSKYPGYKF